MVPRDSLAPPSDGGSRRQGCRRQPAGRGQRMVMPRRRRPATGQSNGSVLREVYPARRSTIIQCSASVEAMGANSRSVPASSGALNAGSSERKFTPPDAK